ncbi:secreted RxLR effector protein 161-like [Humulus lupulus]|uniref:secreted RxLR effector protein 161-like n=1 Tax=Humulus lupulus TaxID=3486 RepID=UPI002B413805|nr:secreted RxLR effector protein 161-like [Humulus lupulus]
MDKSHPLSSPMVVRSLEVKKDPFRPREEHEELLGPEVSYLSAIGALMYLANCKSPGIAFSVNLLARYHSAPTYRHWKGIKHILRYLQGIIGKGLLYSNKCGSQLVGYADAEYLSDPHKAISQTGYLFTCSDTAISWRSTKQTLAPTSSNHAEILAIHEEDNVACIAQLKGGYIKGDRTKHISPKLFFTHDLQNSGDIDVHQIRSSDNLPDLFTKSLPTSTFEKMVHKIGMHRLKDLQERRIEGK